MAILRIDTTGEWIRSGVLTQTYNGALSGACMMRRIVTGGGVAWASFIGTHTATLMSWAWQLENVASSRMLFYNDVTGQTSFSTQTIAQSNTDTWVVGFSMPSGTGQIRFHFKNLTTGAAVVHQNGSLASFTSAPRSTSGGYFKIGTFDNTPGSPGSGDDFMLGEFGVAALWQGVNMSDAQFEELYANKQTSDWHNNTAGVPTMLTELTSLTPTDLESSTTLTVTGATANGDDAVSWNFNGTGPISSNLRFSYSTFPKPKLRRKN